MENDWHICTDGLARNVIFKSREDYVYGMNSVAVCAYRYGVEILAFCLMSNHVHFVVRGTYDNCRQFIGNYKRRLNALADMSGTDVCMKRIADKEYLARVVGYVLRNPVAAGLQVMPWHYAWSSAGLYFRGDGLNTFSCRTIGAYTYKEKRAILNSHIKLPDSYMVSSEGVILPECYVDISAVENVFKTPLQLLYRLSRNDDAELELMMASDVLDKVRHYSDEELAASVSAICSERFFCSSPQELTVEQRYLLASLVYKRYRTGIKQTARLTLTDPGVLKSMVAVRPEKRRGKY